MARETFWFQNSRRPHVLSFDYDELLSTGQIAALHSEAASTNVI